MIIFKKEKDIYEYISGEKKAANNIGFVPTMGALHQGHTSLIDICKRRGDLTVCSIFLNPTQFNDKKDFEKYPVSTDNDIELLIKAGCDILFLPTTEEMYPGGTDTVQTYDFGYLDHILEGAKRPGHFKGVGQIVGRLLKIVNPDRLYLGQKDYQQCMVIKKLKDMIGMEKLEVVICPTLREADGLAMSSRNRRLTDPQRTLSALLYQCLVSVQSKNENASFAIVRKECEDLLTAKGFEPEYVALADARDLTLLEDYTPNTPMVALIAAKIGEIRLIDNLLLQ
jgi:pantoate--beta-alanine ligase